MPTALRAPLASSSGTRSRAPRAHRQGVVLLDLPVEEGLQRAGGRQDGTHETKFEQEAMAFHRRLRSGFLKLVKLEPERILLINAAKPPEAIADAVWTHVQPRLPGG